MSETESVTTEQRLGLKLAADRLAKEFEGTFSGETIDLFSRPATTSSPAEPRWRTFSLSWLSGSPDSDSGPWPASKARPPTGRPFAWSGGSEPGNEVNPAAIAAMAEIGIDISEEFPKPWTEEIVRAADVVVTMGCGDACPLFPGKRYEDWSSSDPFGKSVEEVRPTRDEIGHRVRELLASLGVTPVGTT